MLLGVIVVNLLKHALWDSMIFVGLHGIFISSYDDIGNTLKKSLGL